MPTLRQRTKKAAARMDTGISSCGGTIPEMRFQAMDIARCAGTDPERQSRCSRSRKRMMMQRAEHGKSKARRTQTAIFGKLGDQEVRNAAKKSADRTAAPDHARIHEAMQEETE